MSEKLTANRHRPASSSVGNATLIGETVGDFRILRKLGQGGMGQVFLAEQISLKRKVAIKMLRDEVAANATSLSRFQAEAKTIAKLSHANVVQAYLVGEHEGRWYLAMEYVEGISLREYVERNGPLEVPLVLTIMRQVASALQRAGELGIVHRDIKPENILLTRKAEAKVADFGLSRCLATEERVDLTRAGSTVGTPLYMSPEQIEGKALDGRSDIYSLGVTCYQMLAGQPPFEGSNAFEVATKHVREQPPALAKLRPDVPAALCALIHKMLAKKPDDRHATARELLKDISTIKQSLGTTQTMAVTMDTPVEPAPTIKTPAPKPAPKGKGLLLLAGAGGVAALGVIVGFVLIAGFVWWGRTPEVDPSSRTALAETPAQKKPKEPSKEELLAALRLSVEQHLKDSSPRPGGVEDCIDLAVHYLHDEKTADAEALFKRMCERKAPSSYYFAGRLGLAVTDALNHDHKAAKSKLAEVFDVKAKDQRVQVLKDLQTKKPEFAEWVNETTAWVKEADAQIARKSGPETSAPKTIRRPTLSKGFPFRK